MITVNLEAELNNKQAEKSEDRRWNGCCQGCLKNVPSIAGEGKGGMRGGIGRLRQVVRAGTLALMKATVQTEKFPTFFFIAIEIQGFLPLTKLHFNN